MCIYFLLDEKRNSKLDEHKTTWLQLDSYDSNLID